MSPSTRTKTKAKEKSPTRRQVRRRAQQEISRNELLDTAEAAFGRKGFNDTTLKEIADLAEFAIGSVYTLVESKDDLLVQIFLRRGREFLPQLRSVLGDSGRDPVEQLHAVVDLDIDFFRAHPHFGRLYLRYTNPTMPSAERPIDVALREHYDEAMGLQAAMFARGQTAGVFRSGPPAALSRLLSGLVSAHHAMDPAVVADLASNGAELSLAEFHDLVEATFVVKETAPPRRRSR